MRTFFFSAFLMMNSLLLAQEPQSEFRPVTEIPASEQLPSVPLVIAAVKAAQLWFKAAANPYWGRRWERRSFR